MSDSSEVTEAPSIEAQMLASLEKVSPESAIPESKADSGSGTITPVEATDLEEIPDDDADPDESDLQAAPTREEPNDDESDDDTSGIDDEFAEAMKKRGITTDLSDVPKELRPILLEKVKAMDSGYGKVRQEAAKFRSEQAAFKAEQDYREQHPEQFVADLLTKNPALIDAINDEVKRREDPTYAKALDKERDTARREAALQVKEQEQQELRDHERQAQADRLDAHVESVTKAAGLPLELVEEALASFAKLVMKDEDRLPTEAEIDALVQRHAKIYKKHVGAQKAATARKNTREYLETKRRDKADAIGNGKPSGTVTTTAGIPPRKPASLEEALNAKLDQLGMVA